MEDVGRTMRIMIVGHVFHCGCFGHPGLEMSRVSGSVFVFNVETTSYSP